MRMHLRTEDKFYRNYVSRRLINLYSASKEQFSAGEDTSHSLVSGFQLWSAVVPADEYKLLWDVWIKSVFKPFSESKLRPNSGLFHRVSCELEPEPGIQWQLFGGICSVYDLMNAFLVWYVFLYTLDSVFGWLHRPMSNLFILCEWYEQGHNSFGVQLHM